MRFGKHENGARKAQRERDSAKELPKYNGLNGVKKRAKARAEEARKKSDRINFRAMKILLRELEKEDLEKLNQKQKSFILKFFQRSKLSLKEAIKEDQRFRSEDVVKAFSILKAVDPERAKKLGEYYKFRILK
jgi:hypothetical protein